VIHNIKALYIKVIETFAATYDLGDRI